ncbi:MAG: MBOAT family O-acyltransferase [Bacteroidota bacterium]
MAFIPVYILILIGTIVIDYIAGILIEDAEGKKKQGYLFMSIVANVAVLSIFKYYNFFVDNIVDVLHVFNFKANIPLLNIILPVGLSFHTFQAMSYTIEVYRGNQKAERHFGIYALYVMFYPQLVAGPIERPQNLLHQFHEKHEFSRTDVVAGLRQMMWGLFKKVVIADRLALLVDPAYEHPESATAAGLIIATFLFAYQIYCDFSGYSDIALGAARVMGYKLMVNFRRPYHSKSISEFWRRWHISLFTWFTDYIYNPMVIKLRNGGKVAVVFSVMTIFLISGLWHGAAWKFVIYGALQGIAVVYEILTKKLRKKFFKPFSKPVVNTISWLITMSYLCFTFVIFRAKDMKTAGYILKRIGGIFSEVGQSRYLLTTAVTYLPPLLWIGMLELIYYIQKGADTPQFIGTRPKPVRLAMYYALGFAIYFLGVYENRQFVYFAF